MGSAWINKPMQFKTMKSYLDIISILNVYEDQHTITLPVNIAKDNIYVTLHVNFHETSATIEFHIELDKSWIVPKKLIPQPQIIPLCSPVTSPALLRCLKHYKGRQQVEFLPLTSLFLTTSDFQTMSWTHEILYDDQEVAFVDIATQKQIQNQLQNTERRQQQSGSCSTTQPSKPAIRSYNTPKPKPQNTKKPKKL